MSESVNGIGQPHPGAKSLAYSYDSHKDVMTIEGVKFSGQFFRAFGREGYPADAIFTITGRDETGQLIIDAKTEVDTETDDIDA